MTDQNETQDTNPVTTRRGVRSFVLRQGRMTEGQKKEIMAASGSELTFSLTGPSVANKSSHLSAQFGV